VSELKTKNYNLKTGLIDTHAHIHFRDYASARPDSKHPLPELDEVLANAKAAGVETIITVGTDEEDSQGAVDMAHEYDHVYATVGLHPHDGRLPLKDEAHFRELAHDPRVVAIGECGLDYSSDHVSKADQEKAFRYQIELAGEAGKPMVWHVRDAFDDFFKVVDDYPGINGIVHCFTSDRFNMQKAVDRGFLIALNGIMTFTKDEEQLAAAKAIPLNSLVLETDCPFLAPAPHRGKPNQPSYLRDTAEFLARLRGESLGELSEATTANALRLFNIAR
jgi:TatD DNase family protein